MQLLLLFSLVLAFLNPDSAFISKSILWYITLQVVSSYFLAGVYKLKAVSWRNGVALQGFIHSPLYSPPPFLKRAVKNHGLALLLSWGIIVWELSFPLLFWKKELVLFYLGTGMFFHLINFKIFGLNRFFWVWCASYPAIYYTAVYLAH